MSISNRLALFLSRILFSIVTPLLLVPSIANRRATRSIILAVFGRSYGNRYESIIESFKGRYGLAMAAGLAKAKDLAGNGISVIADCGTGTGFVTRQAAEFFPGATILAFDLLPAMLAQAAANCKNLRNAVHHVQADSFDLPLADGSVDLLLAQNTMPCFPEFARVLRPGGMVVYVDSSAGWIAGLAGRLVRKQGLFGSVAAEEVDMGFVVLAQKQGSFERQPAAGQGTLPGLLRCPVDKAKLSESGKGLLCEQGHQYPVESGFPVMVRRGALVSDV